MGSLFDAFFAHSAPNELNPTGNWQPLREHLAAVARIAKELAEATGIAGLPQMAEAAGWLHDLGKYSEPFQRHIRNVPPKGPKGHKQAGANWAKKRDNYPLTFAILGHHGGMPDLDGMLGQIDDAVENELLEAVLPKALEQCPEIDRLIVDRRYDQSIQTDLFARLVLSCLVDADWADTSEHERRCLGWPEYPAPPSLDPAARLAILRQNIDERARAIQNPDLAAIRGQILDACLARASDAPGLFSLTVPTGGGKTLSGLAFALEHALRHGLRRVIYVAPYISILEQNAKVLRDFLNLDPTAADLFEHQSLADPSASSGRDERQTSRAARRAENWDSPIIVTTNVQFFESLFSNRPARCRKLHNIARSVIILDECQAMSPELFLPTCQMLQQIARQMNSTIVLCTATQPAVNHEKLEEYRLMATEIIPPEMNLFDRLRRVELNWPEPDATMNWPEVSRKMLARPSALCVVNTKAAARDLFTELKLSACAVFHLSTNMCPAHRTAILDRIKNRLRKQEPTYLVSTQLIEAGVDIDFPCVFREMAPLESIIQAAGRCNREGLIPQAGGQVVIFRSEEGATKIPPGWYRKGRDTVDQILNSGIRPSIDNPDDILEYFNRLYWQGNLDGQRIAAKRAGLNFDACAKAYRLIEDDTVPVVVATWTDHAAEIEARLNAARAQPNRRTLRALAPFQVNIFSQQLNDLLAAGLISYEEKADLYVCTNDCPYSSDLGLITKVDRT